MTDGRLRGVGLLVVAVLLMAAAVPGAAQEDSPTYWGTGTNFLFVSGEEFRPTQPSVGWKERSSGFWYSDVVSSQTVVATVRLPVGALITGMTVLYLDNEEAADIQIYLMRQWLTAAGTSGSAPVGPGFLSTGAPGITAVWVDIDPDHTVLYIDGTTVQSYVLRASLPGSYDLCLRGVIIGWNRQVSPAPATATFSDVPVGAFAFQHIEALAASGITAGCGGGNFCPDGYVTRAQMAVFLAKALGLHWAP